jgi:deoxyadenosine/deoxycytidine kinase
MQSELPFKAVNPALRKFGSCLRGKVMVLEGVISAGKSTAGAILTQYVQSLGIPCRFFPEPLAPALLDLFLSDQKKYAFAFQLTMLVKRQALYREAFELAKKGYFCIIDRSLYGDYCFALLHKNKGNIAVEAEKSKMTLEEIKENSGSSEWKSYLEVLHSEKFEHPDYVIYLQVSVDTAIKRCLKRGFKKEDTYDRQYFQDLCSLYDNVIPNSPANHFIVIDWNDEKDDKPPGCIINPILNQIKASYDAM